MLKLTGTCCNKVYLFTAVTYLYFWYTLPLVHFQPANYPGNLGVVFSVQIAAKTRPEKKSGKRRNNADQNNDGHELDEGEAFFIRFHPCPNINSRYIQLKILPGLWRLVCVRAALGQNGR